MGTLYVDTLEPEGATTTLTVGETGQNTVVGGNTIKLNTLKDAGGNTLFTSDGSGNLSSVNSGFGSAMTLLSTQTASTSASLSFTSGITSTYSEYIFRFFNLHPSNDNVLFEFQGSTDGGSNYNTTITSTFLHAWHNQSDSNQSLAYGTAYDQSQGTAYQTLFWSLGGASTESCNGELRLFIPADTTYVKNFYARVAGVGDSPMAMDLYTGGYFNTTSAIDAMSFKMSAGTFDGKIKMYGMK